MGCVQSKNSARFASDDSRVIKDLAYDSAFPGGKKINEKPKNPAFTANPDDIGSESSSEPDDQEGNLEIFHGDNSDNAQRDTSFRTTNKLHVGILEGTTFLNNYIVVDTLGKGSFGKVKLCLNVKDDELYAIKVVDKNMIRQLAKSRQLQGGLGRLARPSVYPVAEADIGPLATLKREVEIMRDLDHPNLVRLYEVIDSRESGKLFMVMEFCEAGALVSPGQLTPARRMPEAIAQYYFKQIAAGLSYLHDNGIIHGDVKPENIMLAGDAMVKIADFGASQVLETGDTKIRTTLGTPAFLSPEICAGKDYKGRPADVWALGITLYNFIYGELPFNSDAVLDLYEEIADATIPYPEHVPVSIELQDLFMRMLQKNPADRITAEEIVMHPWVQEEDYLTLMPSLYYDDDDVVYDPVDPMAIPNSMGAGASKEVLASDDKEASTTSITAPTPTPSGGVPMMRTGTAASPLLLPRPSLLASANAMLPTESRMMNMPPPTAADVAAAVFPSLTMRRRPGGDVSSPGQMESIVSALMETTQRADAEANAHWSGSGGAGVIGGGAGGVGSVGGGLGKGQFHYLSRDSALRKESLEQQESVDGLPSIHSGIAYGQSTDYRNQRSKGSSSVRFRDEVDFRSRGSSGFGGVGSTSSGSMPAASSSSHIIVNTSTATTTSTAATTTTGNNNIDDGNDNDGMNKGETHTADATLLAPRLSECRTISDLSVTNIDGNDDDDDAFDLREDSLNLDDTNIEQSAPSVFTVMVERMKQAQADLIGKRHLLPMMGVGSNPLHGGTNTSGSGGTVLSGHTLLGGPNRGTKKLDTILESSMDMGSKEMALHPSHLPKTMPSATNTTPSTIPSTAPSTIPNTTDGSARTSIDLSKCSKNGPSTSDTTSPFLTAFNQNPSAAFSGIPSGYSSSQEYSQQVDGDVSSIGVNSSLNDGSNAASISFSTSQQQQRKQKEVVDSLSRVSNSISGQLPSYMSSPFESDAFSSFTAGQSMTLAGVGGGNSSNNLHPMQAALLGGMGVYPGSNTSLNASNRASVGATNTTSGVGIGSGIDQQKDSATPHTNNNNNNLVEDKAVAEDKSEGGKDSKGDGLNTKRKLRKRSFLKLLPSFKKDMVHPTETDGTNTALDPTKKEVGSDNYPRTTSTDIDVQWISFKAGDILPFPSEVGSIIYYLEYGTVQLQWEASLPVSLATVFSQALNFTLPGTTPSSNSSSSLNAHMSAGTSEDSAARYMDTLDSVAFTTPHVTNLSAMMGNSSMRKMNRIAEGDEDCGCDAPSPLPAAAAGGGGVPAGSAHAASEVVTTSAALPSTDPTSSHTHHHTHHPPLDPMKKTLVQATERAAALMANATGGSLDNLLLVQRNASQFVGAMSMLDPDFFEARWRATSVATTDVVAIKMTRKGLDLFLSQNPLAQVHLRASMAEARSEVIKLESLERIANVYRRKLQKKETARKRKEVKSPSGSAPSSFTMAHVGKIFGTTLDDAMGVLIGKDHHQHSGSRESGGVNGDGSVGGKYKKTAALDMFAVVAKLRNAIDSN